VASAPKILEARAEATAGYVH